MENSYCIFVYSYINTQRERDMSKEFLRANPVLPVRCVVETAKFFEKELDFTVDILWESPSYGVVRRGNAVIEFGEERKEHVGSGVCVIIVDDSDDIYAEWKTKDIEFVGDLTERDYGSKDFRIKDNNGNILIISHALQNQQALLDKGNVA